MRVGFVVRRLVGALGVMLGLSLLAYLLVFLAPGDPAAVIAAQRLGRPARPEDIALVRAAYGLDRPLVLQYLSWLGQVVRGDLGTSIRSGLPLREELALRFAPTLRLALAATALSLLLGLPAGLLAALRPGSLLDQLCRVLALLGIALPNFLLAFALVLVFSISLGWLPVFGTQRPGAFVLPVVTLASAGAAQVSRMTRALLLDERGQHYLVAARARGLRERLIVWRHMLPNIAVPLLTIVIGQLAGQATGVVVIETLFAWPGLGSYYVTSVEYRDIPALQALLLVFAATFVGLNLVADLAYACIDPRIRLG